MSPATPRAPAAARLLSLLPWLCGLLLLAAACSLAPAAAQPVEPLYRFKGALQRPALTAGTGLVSESERRYLDGLPELKVGLQRVGAPPYEVVGADGEISGFQAETLVRLANLLGLRLRPVVLPDWPSVLQAAQAGQVDLIATVAITPERTGFLDFTLGTVPLPTALFARIGQARAVDGATVAVERGYASVELVGRLYPRARLLQLENTTAALQAVAEGRADFYVGSLLEALDFVAAARLSEIEVRDLLPTRGGHYHFGVRKAYAPLVPILNRAIARTRVEGSAAAASAAEPVVTLPGAPAMRLSALLPLSESQAALLAARPVWRVGAVRGLALLNEFTDGGEHSGVAAEYVSHVAQRIGVGIRVIGFDNVGAMLDALRTGQIDLVPFLTPTPEREREFAFSEPYLQMPYVLLARTDAPQFWDLGSLRGRRLALAPQHPLRPLLARSYPEIVVVDAASGNAAMDMVATGAADAAVEVKLFANLRVNSDAGASLRVLGTVEQLPARFGFAVLRAQAELLPLVDRALAELPRVETDRMLRRWIATDPNPPFPWRRHAPTIAVAAVALLLLAAAALIWTSRLAREVRARRASDAQLDDIGRAIPGVAFRYVVDPAGGFRSAFLSSGAAAFLGFKPDRAKPLLDQMAARIPPAQAEAALALQQRCAASGETFQLTGEYRHPDGRSLWLKVEAVSRDEPDGARVWTGYVVDITPERRLERRMEREARERHLLLASASHELRAPTHTLALALQSLDAETLPPAAQGAVRVAQDAAGTLARLLDEVLDAARVQSGRLEVRPQEFAPRPMLERVAEAWAAPMAAKGLRFESSFDPALPALWRQDPMRLRQVLTNLLSNAQKYTEKGHVHLAAGPTPEGGLGFVVEDSGAGIAPERQASLFEPFAGEPVVPGSSGLGLSICRRIVQAMGGRLELASTPGQGTRVRVTLPAAPAQGAAERPLRAEGDVLLCDDDAVARILMAHALRMAGREVRECQDGRDALEQWRARPARLVITDLRMPGLGGLELMQAIRAEEHGEACRTALVVCSGDPLPEHEAPRADAVLVKPVDRALLVEVLDRLVPLPALQGTGAST